MLCPRLPWTKRVVKVGGVRARRPARVPAGRDDLAELVHDAVGRAQLAAAQRALARDELPEGVHTLLVLARILPLHIAAARICGPATAHEGDPSILCVCAFQLVSLLSQADGEVSM